MEPRWETMGRSFAQLSKKADHPCLMNGAVNPFLSFRLPDPHGPFREARPLDRTIRDGPHHQPHHGLEAPRGEDPLPPDRRPGFPDAAAIHHRAEEGLRCRLNEVT